MTVSSLSPESAIAAVASPNPVVTHLAETVLATTEAVDVLIDRLDQISQQVQQQDYQIFALSEEVKAANVSQQQCMERVDRLTKIMEAMAQNLLTTLPFTETANQISI
ncbi:MAG: hypothetical protein HC805_06500 [Alkalinema sp. RL_2_19]|nr:hypothetical protein [Alkalinema sp. RL_2_19]